MSENKNNTLDLTLTEKMKAFDQESSKAVIGQKKMMHRLFLALITHSHILLEGMPGLAKTTAISTLSKMVQLNFKRIQFTPDLLPADIVGSEIYHPKDHSFSVRKGPLFSNLVLADEINRSPAKVQSALLEAMQEGKVTIGSETFELPQPFLVMATQNPIEQDGTYPLPEAQVDRFLFKVVLDYPTFNEEVEILNLHEKKDEISELNALFTVEEIMHLQSCVSQIHIDEELKKYIVSLVQKTREESPYIRCGASPRATIGIALASRATALLQGRSYVLPEDIKEITPDILQHRIIPSYQAYAENITSIDIINEILEETPILSIDK